MKKADLPKIYSEINHLQTLTDQSQSNARIKYTDLTVAWILLGMTGNKLFTLECNQKTPNQTGFRELTSLKSQLRRSLSDELSYYPCLATDLNVAYTMMFNVKKILSNLGRPNQCRTVNETIYQLGKQIQWHVPIDSMQVQQRIQNIFLLLQKGQTNLCRGLSLQ